MLEAVTKYLGKTIQILSVDFKDKSSVGKVGIVLKVGQRNNEIYLLGTWSPIVIYPSVDKIKVL